MRVRELIIDPAKLLGLDGTSILALKAKAPTKPIEAANAVAVVQNASVVLSTAGTTVLNLTALADGDEFNLISVAAQNMSLDFGAGVSVFAAGIAGTGARYVKFTNVVGTSCRVVRLAATSFYLVSTIGAVTIAAAP